MVDENRIKGAAQDAIGKVEESVGGLMGDSETQVSGKARQAAGEAQNAYGRASDQARRASEKVAQATAEQPLAVFFITLAIGFFFGLMSARR
ncbi:MAG: CsbD family protein [Acidobacteriaceae bacterium]|nr:CsbD family protein [Acidobacteriaceae bacterium]